MIFHPWHWPTRKSQGAESLLVLGLEECSLYHSQPLCFYFHCGSKKDASHIREGGQLLILYAPVCPTQVSYWDPGPVTINVGYDLICFVINIPV